LVNSVDDTDHVDHVDHAVRVDHLERHLAEFDFRHSV
jgi:hypothetical protein